MMKLSFEIPIADLRRLHHHLEQALALIAPWPRKSDDAGAVAVRSYHAAQGSAKAWLSGLAAGCAQPDKVWAARLKTEARTHYAAAGLLAYLAAIGNTEAEDAALRLYQAPADTDPVPFLLDIIAEHRGESGRTKAATALRRDLGTDAWNEGLHRLAAGHNVHYGRILDDVKRAARITW